MPQPRFFLSYWSILPLSSDKVDTLRQSWQSSLLVEVEDPFLRDTSLSRLWGMNTQVMDVLRSYSLLDLENKRDTLYWPWKTNVTPFIGIGKQTRHSLLALANKRDTLYWPRQTNVTLFIGFGKQT